MALHKWIYRFFVLVFLIIQLPALQAQEVFVEPPSKPVTQIPFVQLTGGIVIIKATLGGYPDTLNFILDSGSSGISLDSSTVDYLGLTPAPSDKTIRGVAGMKKVSFLYNQKLHFPGLTVDSLNFHINDYSILTAVYGEQIDGIVGYSVISRYILKLDYDSLTLTFCTPGTIRYPRGGYLMRPSINMLVASQARIKENISVSSNFLFDLGAGLSMLLSKEFVEDSNFIDRRKKTWTKEGEGLGGKIDMQLMVMKEIKIGPYRFRKVPTFIFDDENNVTSYPYMCGILGNDILRRFNVTINYRAGEIHLIPNSHYGDPFDYSYSGIELYLINGVIVVGDVAKESPAEVAGVKEGDEVIGINKVFNQSLNLYKIALQSANEKVKMILRRDGKMFEAEFKVKSILR